MKSKQEIFTASYTRMLAQGEPSTDGKSCIYRKPNGHGCAIGVLISDELAALYDSGDNDTIFRCVDLYIEKTPSWIKDNVNFLSDIQCCHDNYYHLPTAEWLVKFKIGMAEVARQYGLHIA